MVMEGNSTESACSRQEIIRGKSLRNDEFMQWIKVRRLGQGGYGFVALAKIIKPSSCIPASKDYAVKYAPAPSFSLSKECRILQNFHGCPNIVQVYGDMQMSMEYDIPYHNLFLEYAPGGNLLNLIRKSSGNRIPESDVRNYTRMLLQGLRDIHGKGYVHCDLKPENILIFCDKYGSLSITCLKIADFGLAKEPGERDVRDPKFPYFRGIADYMSPESVKDGKITVALDIWSLGCVVAEMITGEIPWESSTGIEDLRKKIWWTEELPNMPEDMSEAGKDFLVKCFARDPEERWTAERLLNHPFLFADRTESAPNTQRSSLQVGWTGSSNGLGRQPVLPHLL